MSLMNLWSFKDHQAFLFQNYACHSWKAVSVMFVSGINNVDPTILTSPYLLFLGRDRHHSFIYLHC